MEEDQRREPIFAQGAGLKVLKFALGLALALAIGWLVRAVVPPLF